MNKDDEFIKNEVKDKNIIDRYNIDYDIVDESDDEEYIKNILTYKENDK